uniref:Uncharacterized protein n=1 Tax=Aegilops tauschii subsp. strangulata TaxID=200361 RepID=A0A453M4L6_AEGTS
MFLHFRAHSWSGFAFQKVYKWEYMKYYSLNRGEDGACSMMMPPSATNSSNMASTPMLVFLSMFTAVIMACS